MLLTVLCGIAYVILIFNYDIYGNLETGQMKVDYFFRRPKTIIIYCPAGSSQLFHQYLFSPSRQETSKLPVCVLLRPCMWERLRRLLWTALQCQYRSGVYLYYTALWWVKFWVFILLFFVGILYVHHYFTEAEKWNAGKNRWGGSWETATRGKGSFSPFK